MQQRKKTDSMKMNYDACDVSLSVYPHGASLKNMSDHGENRTYDFVILAQCSAN